MEKCSICSGKGYYYDVCDEQRKEFEKRFDHYADMGICTLGEARRKALEGLRLEKFKCPECS